MTSLRTPDNVEELKELYKNNQLIYYTPLEELINTITHALGAVIGVILMGFMLAKASIQASYATAVVACVAISFEFTISAIYHGVKDLNAKRIWRSLDYPAVCLNVIACGTALCLMYNVVFGYIALSLSLAIAIAMFVLCRINFKRFRIPSVISCFVIGALIFAQFFVVFFSDNRPSQEVSYMYLAGLILCLIGAALFGVHKRYAHCIFHVFVLVGPLLFIGATYLQIV